MFSPCNLEALKSILSLSRCSVAWAPGVRLPYSETSDSCKRHFSDISVILITGALLFFFFRNGVLTRWALEAATGNIRGGGGKGLEVWEPLKMMPLGSPPHPAPLFSVGQIDSPVLGLDCTVLTTAAGAKSILGKEGEGVM